ncbi:hypothetical protein E2C01_020819 [Portunus trituberculatus]|uniref:Uncharacterized protein n=1 Tax=Portunus trituberculatus TaxID=210409 RepID=A0A5B7E4H9_PORTR|nr:hypothetical protein [Portunus trituberculatus]
MICLPISKRCETPRTALYPVAECGRPAPFRPALPAGRQVDGEAAKKWVEEKQATGDVVQTLEDVARKCLGDDHPCWPWLLDDDGEGDNEEGEEEDGENIFDLAESKYVVTKWIMAYVAIIIVTSVLTLAIGYPYLITGQTFRSLHSLPLPDHQDSLLLLTWLLGEASGDESCLERVVCLNPERSARYLAVPNIFTSFFSRWVPVHYREQLGRLGDVTQNGLSHTCDQYLCPVLPNL